VSWLLAGRDLDHVHHGGAIGADADFHRLVLAHRPDLGGTIHPCDIASQREDFTVDELRGWTVLAEKRPLDRNKDIVSACDRLLACVASDLEELRSGTWSTIRHARDIGRWLVVLGPSGNIIERAGDQ
jgi:hypothetical protein